MSSSLWTKSARWNELEENRRHAVALLGGQKAVQRLGEEALPRWEAEESKDYEKRLKAAKLEPWYEDAVDDLAGRVFANEIQLLDDVPPEIGSVEGKGGFWQNLDNCGKDGQAFCRQWFRQGIGTGQAAVLVDHTPEVKGSTAAGATEADEQRAGARPYFVLLAGGSYDVEWKVVAGVRRRAMVRVWDAPVTEIVAGKEETVERMRVLYRGGGEGTWARYEVRRKTKEGDVVDADEKGNPKQGFLKNHVEIPLVEFEPRMDARPPLQALADLCIEIYQDRSNYDTLLACCAVPVTTARGLREGDAKQMEIRAGSIFYHSTSDTAEWKVMEMSGTSAAALRANLQDKREMAKRLSKEPLSPRPTGDSTATASIIQSKRANSGLDAWFVDFLDRLEEALRLMMVWKKGTTDATGGSVQATREYGYVPEGDLVELRALGSEGYISKETVRAEAKRRGTLSAAFDETAELERLEREAEKSLGLIGSAEDIDRRVADLEAKLAALLAGKDAKAEEKEQPTETEDERREAA
jgi:hypothetical protein